MLRRYRPDDAVHLLALYQDTIRRVNCRDYSPQQIDAWASPDVDLDRWAERFTGRLAWVAEYAGTVAGFADLSLKGYLDRLFVSADHQRRGIATALLQRLIDDAQAVNIKQIVTEASITAKPFFASRGFTVTREQQVDCRGVRLTNYLMVRPLDVTDELDQAVPPIDAPCNGSTSA